MKNNHFHSDFKLNGNSFRNVEELLHYTAILPKSIHLFFQDWFSHEQTVSIKTSGSTGKPMWIELQKQHMVHSAKATGAFFNLHEKTTALLCLPTKYIAGKMMLVRALVLGWHIDIGTIGSNPLENNTKTYDFSAMIPMQLKNSFQKIHLIKKLIVGGGEISVSLERELQDVSTEVYATYGMTETITHIAVKKLNHGKWNHFRTLPNITLSKDNRNCLVIHAPKLSDKAIITNDVVMIISSKEFDWKGRYDFVINSGGVKLHPEEIERKLVQHIHRRFFITGAKDEVLGEKLVLIIEGKIYKLPDMVFTDLEKYEVPKETIFIESFVETPTGKVQRKKTLNLNKR